MLCVQSCRCTAIFSRQAWCHNMIVRSQRSEPNTTSKSIPTRSQQACATKHICQEQMCPENLVSSSHRGKPYLEPISCRWLLKDALVRVVLKLLVTTRMSRQPLFMFSILITLNKPVRSKGCFLSRALKSDWLRPQAQSSRAPATSTKLGHVVAQVPPAVTPDQFFFDNESCIILHGSGRKWATPVSKQGKATNMSQNCICMGNVCVCVSENVWPQYNQLQAWKEGNQRWTRACALSEDAIWHHLFDGRVRPLYGFHDSSKSVWFPPASCLWTVLANLLDKDCLASFHFRDCVGVFQRVPLWSQSLQPPT